MRKVCAWHGCRRKVRARGYCDSHYKRSGALGVCTVDGCGRFVVARGWCTLHYQRWQRTGDPTHTVDRSTIVRRDAAGHGTRRRYDLGCRCLPCAVENARYQTDRNQGRLRRVDAALVRDHLTVLVESGWTKGQIADEAGLSSTTIWYIENRSSKVNSRTADAILSVEPFRQVRLDPAPLIDRLGSRGMSVKSLPDAQSKALYRARAQGWITDQAADRIAVDALGLTLEEVYGPDWDEVAA